MWDHPGPGLEHVSFVLAGRFLTTAPPGKPRKEILFYGGFKTERTRCSDAGNSLNNKKIILHGTFINIAVCMVTKKASLNYQKEK